MVPGWLGRLVRMHMVMTRSFVTRLGMRWLAVVHDSAVLEDDRSFDQNLQLAHFVQDGHNGDSLLVQPPQN